ncbi:MAG TPA: hypothetical protein VJ742_06950, partial [Nitrososphaera sp.]|nr:hypothetical protein [Nitrososphaera sp.]
MTGTLQIALALVLTVILPRPFGVTEELQPFVAAKQEGIELAVSLVADKPIYKRGDRIRLDVTLTNTNPVKDVFVYGTLQFGLSGSLMLFRRDAKGNEVPTRFVDTGSELPPKSNDTAAFVKLRPFHFLGKPYKSTIHMLHLEKPGRYKLWVEYHCPISSSEVEVKPFFGEEMGTLKSNVVWITVV